ncbi:MAG: MlaC/ttg2D family ABC transporter substrate-binding protein [Parvibaculales bacterium]
MKTLNARIIAAIALLLGSLSLAAAQSAGGEAFVRESADEVIDILTTASGREEREQRFTSMLNERADLRRIGRFALGAEGRRVSKTDFETYQELLETLIIKVYANRLGDYSDEQIIIKGSQQKKRNVIVETEITFTSGREPISLDWWLIEQKNGGYKLFDIRVLGVWMAQEQRDTFTSVLKNNKGDFNALLGHLRRQVKEGLEENAKAQTSG